MNKKNFFNYIENIFSILTIIFIILYTIEYFNLLGGISFLNKIKNINSYLLILSGISFLLTTLFEISRKLKNNISISKFNILISIIVCIIFIILATRIWNEPRGTCPFSGHRPNTNYEEIK